MLGQVPIHHISRPFFFYFFLVFKILIFYFFNDFFAFVNMGPYGRKLQTTSPLKLHIKFPPKILCILLGRVCTKVVQRIVKFQILNFCRFFFSFSLTWGHMRVKVLNDISSERTHQICSPKFMILLGWVSTKVV